MARLDDTTNNIENLLADVPDAPACVELRSSLLHGDCQFYHYEKTGSEYAYVLHDDDADIVYVHGDVPADSLRPVLEHDPEDLTVLCGSSEFETLRRVLPNWTGGRADIFALPDEEELPAPEVGKAGWLGVASLPELSLPPVLRDELLDASTYSRIACGLQNEKPVSFCYAASRTETLWDVSIDTLAANRRQGHARSAVQLMAQHQAEAGRRTVWGAMEDNPASSSLALKLGLRPVAEIYVFTLQ